LCLKKTIPTTAGRVAEENNKIQKDLKVAKGMEAIT
jgi:hypothetical protein